MDSVSSDSDSVSDLDRLELPSLAQGNLISLIQKKSQEIELCSVHQDRLVSTSQGIQTSPVVEASPVQHIQDVYGSPSCEEDLTQHRVEEKVPFWKKEKKIDFRPEDYIQPEFSQDDRNRSDIGKLVYGDNSLSERATLVMLMLS